MYAVVSKLLTKKYIFLILTFRIKILENRSRSCLRKAEMLVFVSQFEKKDLCSYFEGRTSLLPTMFPRLDAGGSRCTFPHANH